MAFSVLNYVTKKANFVVLRCSKSYPNTTSVFECLGSTLWSSNPLCYVSHLQYSSSKESDVENKVRRDVGDRNKRESGPKITLISNDNNILVTSLQEAQKISHRRDLKLVKMIDFDTKTQRAVYKLMTGAEYFEADRKQRQLKAAKKDGSVKGDKMVTITHRISEHDLQSRIKIMIKWLDKNYEARVVINGDASNSSLSEKVYKFIEDAMKDHGRIVQKRLKGTDIRFQIIPLKKEKEHKSIDDTETASNKDKPIS